MEPLEENVKILRLLGLLESTNRHSNWKTILRHFSLQMTLLVNSYIITVGGPMFAYVYSQSMPFVFEAISNILMQFQINTKIVTIVWQNDGLHCLINSMKNMYIVHASLDKEAKKIVDSTVKTCHFITVTLPVTILALSFTVMFGAMLRVTLEQTSKEMEQQGKVWFPFDVFSTYMFPLTAVCAVMCTIHGVVAVIVIISLIASMMQHIVAQFQLLNHTIGNLKQTAVETVCKKIRFPKIQNDSKINSAINVDTVEEEFCEEYLTGELDCSSNKTARIPNQNKEPTKETKLVLELKEKLVSKEMDRLLGKCVDHHSDIIRFWREFEAFFHSLFGLIMVSNLTISVLILASPNLFSDSTVAAFFAPRVLYLLLQLLLYCYLADRVSEENSKVSAAIMACDWLASSDRFKSSMRIIIAMSNQPIVIKAAGFVPLVSETFTSIIKTAYSYYAVLSDFA